MGIIRSNSKFRFGWDALILILILLSTTIIPYQVAFQHDISTSGSILVYVIDIVFIADIFLQFFFSFRSKGKEILDKYRIRSHYIKSFLFIDVISNFPFDLLYLLFVGPTFESGISVILVLRLLRLGRLIRLVRVFRQWKLHHWINPGIVRITRLAITIFILIHAIACSWFLLAYSNGFKSSSWVVSEGLTTSSEYEQYVRSLYWTITTMTTVGYGDITPSLPEEYIIAMIVMLLGASFYAFIIGNVASIFSNIDSRKNEYWNNVESVMQYLNFRNIPREVADQFRDYYEYMWAQKRGLKEDELLNDLPEPLRIELLQNLAKDVLIKVPLFKYSSPQLKNVLLKIMKNETYPPGVEIVKEGEVGSDIYFISIGTVEVLSENGKITHCTLESGEYFGDLSMLLKEKRTGSVKTAGYCEVFILPGAKFDEIKETYKEFKSVMAKMSAEKSEKMAALLLDGIVL